MKLGQVGRSARWRRSSCDQDLDLTCDELMTEATMFPSEDATGVQPSSFSALEILEMAHAGSPGPGRPAPPVIRIHSQSMHRRRIVIDFKTFDTVSSRQIRNLSRAL